MTDKILEVNYRLTAEELTRLMSYLQVKVSGVRLLLPWHWYYRLVYFAIPIVVVVPYVLSRLSKKSSEAEFYFVLICTSIIGLWFVMGEITVYLIYCVMVRLFWRRYGALLQTPPYRNALAPRRIRIGPDGVLTGTDVCVTRYRWSAFWKLANTRNFLYLCVGGAAEVVPRRAFPDEACFQEFVALARHYHAVDTSAPFASTDGPPPETYHATDLFDDRPAPRR